LIATVRIDGKLAFLPFSIVHEEAFLRGMQDSVEVDKILYRFKTPDSVSWNHSCRPTPFVRNSVCLRGILCRVSFNPMPITPLYLEPHTSVAVIPRNPDRLDRSFVNLFSAIHSLAFEPASMLTRIESCAFSSSRFWSLCIRGSIEVLCEDCFFSSRSLSSMTFESGSKLLASSL
jgi:hypothetical protein